MKKLIKWQEKHGIKGNDGLELVKQDGTFDANRTFNIMEMEKGAENELWEAVAYEVPALGSNLNLINNISHKVNMTANDTVHIPTLTGGTPTIYREGSTPSYSGSAYSPGVVDINTKDQCGIPFILTRKQKESMSFNLMAGVLNVQGLAVQRSIQKDVMAVMALGLAAGNRIEFASGNAWTVDILSSIQQKLLENGGDPNNLVIAVNPERFTALYALEDTEGRNLFLDASVYGQGEPLATGVVGKIMGMDVIIVNDLPGVEDDWSAIETTETHFTCLAFDRSAIAVALEAAPYVFEVTSIGTGGWEYLLQRFFGAKLINANLVVGIKLYEA